MHGISHSMEEAVEEHQSKSISFSMVEESKHRAPRRDRSGIRNTVETETRNFQIPAVVLSPKKRQGRRSERRCCNLLCIFRIILLLLPLVYYKEIAGILSLAPQTVMSYPSVNHDYSSVRSAHDLNSEIVQPKCFVSLKYSCYVFCPKPNIPLTS
jgi:hypothetical protein